MSVSTWKVPGMGVGAARVLTLALALAGLPWSPRPAAADGQLESAKAARSAQSAAASARDLRLLVEFTYSKYSPTIGDGQVVRIQVFRNGLLHYDESLFFDREVQCISAYSFGLGTATRSQLETLEEALRRARIGDQTGNCSLQISDDTPTTYHLTWIGQFGDRATRISFVSGQDFPDPPPPPACDGKLEATRAAILAFTEQVLALRTTRKDSGSSCYPPL